MNNRLIALRCLIVSICTIISAESPSVEDDHAKMKVIKAKWYLQATIGKMCETCFFYEFPDNYSYAAFDKCREYAETGYEAKCLAGGVVAAEKCEADVKQLYGQCDWPFTCHYCIPKGQELGIFPQKE